MEDHRDELISWKENGMFIFEEDNKEDQMPGLIDKADNDVKRYKKILIEMEAPRDRAIKGNDV